MYYKQNDNIVYLNIIFRALHEYSLYCLHLRLNESKEELRKDKKEEGLAEDSAPRENLYGIELPINLCTPFNADFDFILKSL